MKARSVKIAIGSIMCVLLSAVCVVAWLLHEQAAAYDAYYKKKDSFADSVFTSLDYGIYWYDNDGRIPKKAGTAGANFDPNKPTIIFTHGMKIGEGYNRRDLVSLWYDTNSQFKSKGYDAYMYYDQYYQILLDMGYNVGHFYWNQLAEISTDEDYRIWTSDIEGGLSYFVSNRAGAPVQGDTRYNPTDSVSVLYSEAIKSALGADYNQPLRLVGHSMGGQLTLAVTQNLLYQQKHGKIGANLIPERISLIDPYICNTKLTAGMRIDHLGGKEVADGTWTGELCADALDDIAAYGIAVDAYGGSLMVYRNYYFMTETIDFFAVPEDDPAHMAAVARCNELSERLCRGACWTFLDGLQAKYGMPACHCMIIDYYFTTMYEDMQTDNFGQVLPSVTDSTVYIRSLRGVCFMQKDSDDGSNPFYRHTTDFVRVDVNWEPLEGVDAQVLYGTMAGYKQVALLDSAAENVLQTTSVSTLGEYHFYGVEAGNYVLRFVSASDKVEANITVAEGASDAGSVTTLTIDKNAARVDGADTKVVRGHAEGYDKVLLLDAATDDVVMNMDVDAEGNYRFYGVEAGNYIVRFESYDAIAEGNLIVTSGTSTDDIITFDAQDAVVSKLPSTAMTLVYILIIPALALLLMVAVIVASVRTVKRAKARK